MIIWECPLIARLLLFCFFNSEGKQIDKFESPGKNWSKLGRASRIRASTENSRSSQMCTEAHSKSSDMIHKVLKNNIFSWVFEEHGSKTSGFQWLLEMFGKPTVSLYLLGPSGGPAEISRGGGTFHYLRLWPRIGTSRVQLGSLVPGRLLLGLPYLFYWVTWQLIGHSHMQKHL